MARKTITGLYERNGIWHVDKVVRGQRLQESTGTSNREEAEQYPKAESICWIASWISIFAMIFEMSASTELAISFIASAADLLPLSDRNRAR